MGQSGDGKLNILLGWPIQMWQTGNDNLICHGCYLCIIHTPILDFTKKKRRSRKQRKWLHKKSAKKSWFGYTQKKKYHSMHWMIHKMISSLDGFFWWSTIIKSWVRQLRSIFRAKLVLSFVNTTFTFSVMWTSKVSQTSRHLHLPRPLHSCLLFFQFLSHHYAAMISQKWMLTLTLTLKRKGNFKWIIMISLLVLSLTFQLHVFVYVLMSDASV